MPGCFALEEQYEKANIDGRAITNLRFADGVDALAEEELELEAQATQLMTNSANDIQRDIKVNEHKLGTLTSFKYYRAVVLDDGLKPEFVSEHKPLNLLQRKISDNNCLFDQNVNLTILFSFPYFCMLVNRGP